MTFFKMIDHGTGLKRLFIGGVHGKEGLTTIKALSQILDSDVKSGKLLVYNCPTSSYISTLNPRYYKSKLGEEILNLINRQKPQVYLEAHCYRPKSYQKLIGKHRKDRVGVPPLIELEKGVLIGSVSPYIRTTLFKAENVCITLEIPCSPSEASLNVYVNILKTIAGSRDRKELENRLKVIYPSQVKTARKYAREFFGDYPPF
jgi:hypothetical protein